MKSIGTLILAFVMIGASAQEAVYKFWIQFSDKEGNPYSMDRPGEFLSVRAIEKRQRYHIPIPPSVAVQ